ncbi:N-acetylmuramoyl-L-alanine amidase, partial [Candidatus Gastranaerophilus sp. (ex Termes propinquus)]
SSSVTFSAFEEGGHFYLDLQNVADVNQTAFDNLVKNPKFSGLKTVKIASDKTRFVFPLNAGEKTDMDVSYDGRVVKLHFKIQPKPPQGAPAGPVITAAPPARPAPKESSIGNLFKVVIDPGHGGSDVGATRANVFEKDLNLDISHMIVKNLNKQGVFVEMTREKCKTVELSERTNFCNKIVPDLFVSVHTNASVKEDIYGIETHWWKDNSVALARAIHLKMTTPERLKSWETVDRGLFKSQFYVINHSEAPAVLVEIGYLSNPAERAKLLDKKRQEEIAEAISEGIMEYLKKGAQ